VPLHCTCSRSFASTWPAAAHTRRARSCLLHDCRGRAPERRLAARARYGERDGARCVVYVASCVARRAGCASESVAWRKRKKRSARGGGALAGPRVKRTRRRGKSGKRWFSPPIALTARWRGGEERSEMLGIRMALLRLSTHESNSGPSAGLYASCNAGGRRAIHCARRPL
jgi:hypothetical protein